MSGDKIRFHVINESLDVFDQLNDSSLICIMAIEIAIYNAFSIDGIGSNDITDDLENKYFCKLNDEHEFDYDADTEIFTSYFKSINLVVNISGVPKERFVDEIADFFSDRTEKNIELFRQVLINSGFSEEETEGYVTKYFIK